MLCQSCKNQEATLHMMHNINGQQVEVHVCENCGGVHASNAEIEAAISEAMGIPFADIMRDIFSSLPDEIQNATSGFAVDGLIIGLGQNLGQGISDDDVDDLETDGDDDDLDALLGQPHSPLFEEFSQTSHQNPARRCPKCSITWDRLRQDGRAGCARCYETFAAELGDVMQRMQHGTSHRGKAPRAAVKRLRRLEQLRAKRDNRLEMLNNRLKEAVTEERYEEAAQLRDQIKMVAGPIDHSAG